MAAKLTVRNKETGEIKNMYAVDAKEWCQQPSSGWEIIGQKATAAAMKIQTSEAPQRSEQITASGKDLNTFTVAQLKSFADDMDINYSKSPKKHELIQMLIDAGFNLDFDE